MHQCIAPILRLLTLHAIVVVTTFAFGARARADEAPVDFDRDVQRILSDNCYHCHGPDAGRRKAKLRLDVLDDTLGPFSARDEVAIVPGKPDESELIRRITTDDEDDRMPPVDSNRHLKPEQIEILKRWVAQGAKWGKHWAFVSPKRVELPAVKDAAWSRNAIDRFILSRLEKENIAPSPEAPKETLIRRVTLDLTGLPSTPEEVDAFIADTSPDAYEKVVDRLLASPRYGERMVWEWLEASRYADTNGYQNDPVRTMWPWRDWVVKAMNDNMPFDQFVTWQLAGDLLPNATQTQQLASAFNRNHPYNGEGGRILEETRVEHVLDRVDTTATTFLGLTVACARCHDHKFDQISQKEYYSFYAYFNQSSEGTGAFANAGDALPVMNFTTDAEQQTLTKLQADAKAAADRVVADGLAIDARQAAWETAALADKGWTDVAPISALSTGGATMTTQPDSSVLVSGTNPDTDVHEVVLKTDLGAVTAIRVEAFPDPSLPLGGPGRSSDSGNFVLSNIEASAASVADPSRTHIAKFASSDATYSQGGFDAAAAIDGDPQTGWAVLKAGERTPVSAIFRFTEPAGFSGGSELRLKFHYASQHKQHAMGRFKISLTGGSAMTPDVASTLAVAIEQRTDAQKTLVRDFYRTRVDKEFTALNNASAAARKAADDFDRGLLKVMVMNDATPRETHVLVKGAYDKPTDKVEPGVFSVLNPLPTDTANNRLALAKWIVDPANPLAARVIVNRYWQQFFGIGIVKTVDDFGVQGERPVHPELLDWLAVEFMESGWNVKALHRLIVTSGTYKQSSKVTPDAFERDPENRLLSRGARFRLPAITIRDQALATSGLLVEKVGGAPVKTYQPPGVWEEATFGQIKYEQDHGEALYRRSVYIFWRRIVGPTNFFDTASRSVCSVRPSHTNTPLHALTTLNDTTFVEAARALAQRVMTTGGATDPERIQRACRLVLSRPPTPKEQDVMLAGLARLKSQYTADPESATKLLVVGESKRDEALNPSEHAAYTGLCLAILNMDEALTKD